MVKPIDSQVMTHRSTEYQRDMSQMLHRDELLNASADASRKANDVREAQTVVKRDNVANKRVHDHDEESKDQLEWEEEEEEEGEPESETEDDEKSEEHRLADELYKGLSVGKQTRKILDIEV